ncbi:hypothetical protein IE53DRAFT_384772 [Violaceomyces palustris]|uniref:Uncharacterized protein n=1 Tax=Violaceomyces palustris TaxID=1673888 RepID=A0ACD0P3T6_9BASI|nr:hypothetical protein IE53DRAFT_384772 [Violaceomyces palustris]
MVSISSQRSAYLLAGILLRVALILWSRYQDAHYDLPYTDVDYSVFSDASALLLNGCPVSETVYSPFIDVQHDLENQIELKPNLSCAKGFLPSLARFSLLNDPIHVRPDQESPFDQESFMFKLSIACFDLVRPLFRSLASLGDPYARPTYRYTPFLAALLIPIHSLALPEFGKYLFAIADILCAILMWALLDGRSSSASKFGSFTHLPGLLWLLNPFPAQISTRGSSESLVGLSILSFLYLFLRSNPELPAGIQELSSRTEGKERKADRSDQASEADRLAKFGVLPPESSLPFDDWSLSALLAPIMLGLAVHLKLFPVIYAIPVLSHLYTSSSISLRCDRAGERLGLFEKHRAGIRFGIVAALTFFSVNLVAWSLWGQPFVENTFTYHLTRKDHRHNFSPYFLTNYLSSVPSLTLGGGEGPAFATWTRGSSFSSEVPTSGGLGTVRDQIVVLASEVASSSLTSFLPQLGLTSYVGWVLGGKDVVSACAAQTLVFVTFNKVCTSQYFMWFLWLLPVILPSLRFKSRVQPILMISAWVATQSVWLGQAYLLEFKAKQVFLEVWSSSLLLLVCHCYLIVACLDAWRRERRVLTHQVESLADGKKEK